MKRIMTLAVLAVASSSMQAHDDCAQHPGMLKRAFGAVTTAAKSAGNYVSETRAAGIVKKGYAKAGTIAAEYPKTSKVVAAVAVAGLVYAVYAKLAKKSIKNRA